MPKAETVPGSTRLYIEQGGAKINPRTMMGAQENLEADLYPGFEDTLSVDRFDKYLGWAGGNRNRAIELYTLNTRLSESLYVSLHMLEVTLRNRIYQVMSAVEGDTWYDLPRYQANGIQADMLAKARRDLADAHKQETPGAIVAALTFGYWTAMLGKEYENLWQTTLKRIAKREDGKGLRRKDFSSPLSAIRILRNRLAHHEPVLNWDLPKHHRNIIQMTTWLSPVAAEWCQACCRFIDVYPQTGIDLHKP